MRAAAALKNIAAFVRRRAGRLSLSLLAVFAINVCVGKYWVLTGTGTAAPLDGIPEFLILAAAVVFFIVAVLSSDS